MIISRKLVIIQYPVAIEKRIHLYPYRTQKLSFSSSKILGWRRPGKIEHCWNIIKPTARGWFFVFSTLLCKKISSVLQGFSALLALPCKSSRFSQEDKPRSAKKGWACEKVTTFSNEHCWNARQIYAYAKFF